MTRIGKLALACLLLPTLAAAQDARLKLPDFSSLAGKATETVNISLGPWLLHMAGAFIDDKDEDAAARSICWPGSTRFRFEAISFRATSPIPPPISTRSENSFPGRAGAS